jgi:CHAT domain-containing protein
MHYLSLLQHLENTGLEVQLEAGLLESEIHFIAGDYAASKKACLRVCEVLVLAHTDRGELNAQCKLQLGKIAMKQGELQEALNLQHLALLNFAEHFDSADPMTNPSLEQLYRRLMPVEILYFKSKILSSLYESTGDAKYLIASWQTINLDVQFVDKVRQSYYDAEDKAFLIDQSYRVFSQALSLCHLQLTKSGNEAWADTAFALMERSKALNLMDAVKHENARQFAGIPDSILEIESQLRLGISLREESIREMRTGAEDKNEIVLITLSDLEKEKKVYRALLKSIEAEYPEYYQLKYGVLKNNLKDIQEILGEDESVIEYFVAEEMIFTLVVERNRKQLFVNRDAKLVGQQIGRYQESIEACINGANNKVKDSMYINSTVELYERLVVPLLPLKSSIIVIQDGPLYYLSFAGLITEQPAQYYDWRKHSYMVNEREISYCYSMTLCHELRQKSQAGTDRSMIFAPDFEQDGGVSRLEFNGEEARQVALMTSGESLMNADCTTAAVRDVLSTQSGYRLVHFATHGVANTANGTDSYLQFAGPQESNRLYARELYNYSINADLVYLSACETGSGQLRRGEGVISIARAFFFAGTRSLVTALWSISDERAKDLTLGFYKELMDGTSVDGSVASSQRQYIRNLSTEQRNLAHPAYWSALVPIGSSLAIVPASNLNWLLYLAGLLVIMYALVRMFKKKSA